ncbi:MAG TPA: DUF4038 domain-containing protein [Burkholderiales bacterium]|nr:DUF4038 domain-containing protein [Burkholderiales bacterium]
MIPGTIDSKKMNAGVVTQSREMQMLRTRYFYLVPVAAMLAVGIFLGLASCGGGGGGGDSSAAAVAQFPVAISGNPRYLVDRTGKPFPILGRTAWFITSLSAADYRMFIDDTVAKRYNAIEFHVINHDPRGNHPPTDGNGNPPFARQLGSAAAYTSTSQVPDFTMPNEAYWSGVDALLAYAESKGVLCFMFPAYAGFGGGNQGWMQEMAANGATNMQTYGAWIATRYKNQRNIVWMAGGDQMIFSSTEQAAENGLLAGLRSVANQQSMYLSAEWTRGSIATDQTDFGAFMTLNGTYANSTDINNQGRRAYALGTMPAFLLEEPYDQEGADGNNVNPDATQPVRRFQWWGVLSNIGGYISGNGYVWPFRSTGVSPPTTDNWKLHLNTPGAQDMAHLNAFVRSISWYHLVPSGLGGMATLVTSGAGSLNGSDYVSAAATADGTLLVAYIPPANSAASIAINMSALGNVNRARWFDPTSGAFRSASGLPGGTFSLPAANAAGDNDWVLVLDKQ